jgi:hypothetical protein
VGTNVAFVDDIEITCDLAIPPGTLETAWDVEVTNGCGSVGLLPNYFNIVTQVTLSGDVQPIFNNYCISCHNTGLPSEGLDLTSGNAYSNTVNIDSVQSAIKRITPGDVVNSYLMAKILGIHLMTPYNGSGVKMPENGPPFLTPEESNKIRDWILQGALDN